MPVLTKAMYVLSIAELDLLCLRKIGLFGISHYSAQRNHRIDHVDSVLLVGMLETLRNHFWASGYFTGSHLLLMSCSHALPADSSALFDPQSLL